MAYRRTGISSFPRVVLVPSLIGLTFLARGLVITVITASAAPSLRPLVPSGSLIRYEPVQVYYNEPRSRVPLDPVYHIIYPGD
jgi:hypothetical protein